MSRVAYRRGVEELVRNLDRAYLQLCVALIDHTLQGDHFESVILSFFAVLGVDENLGGVFRGPLLSPQICGPLQGHHWR
jgi:hypothetical protein